MEQKQESEQGVQSGRCSVGEYRMRACEEQGGSQSGDGGRPGPCGAGPGAHAQQALGWQLSQETLVVSQNGRMR